MKRTRIKLEEKLNSLNEFSPFSAASIPVIDSNNNGLKRVSSSLNELLSQPDNFQNFNPNFKISNIYTIQKVSNHSKNTSIVSNNPNNTLYILFSFL
jgi:hypothetical protein